MANLADILVTFSLDTKDFNEALKKVQRDITNMTNTVGSATVQLGSQVASTMTGASQSVSDFGRSTSSVTKSFSTDMQSMYNAIKSANREFEMLGQAGKSVSEQVAKDFSFLPKHLQRYVQALQDAGKTTEAFSQLNEKYGKRNLEQLRKTNDYLVNSTTQATKIISALKEQDIQPLSQQFLKLGERLERTAKQGSALNLALKQLGENASPQAVAERVKLIESGVGRARVTMLYMGIVTGLATWGLIEMSNVVDGRLKPAFEKLKGTWLEALTPFVKAFTTFVLWIMSGAQAIGELMKRFAEAHPQLSQMFWGFIYLTMALTTLLAPLAVAIGLTGGLSAGFALLWSSIAPFVLGFLTVAGVAVLVAGAIVTLTAIIYNLWTSSEAFRNAWTTLWNNVKTAFTEGFITPVSTAWENLKLKFMEFITALTGGEAKSMGDFWTWLGDRIAVVATFIGQFVLPFLRSAFEIAGMAIGGVINTLAYVFQWLGDLWKQNGDSMSQVAMEIFEAVYVAFVEIRGFLFEIMPQVKDIISKGFELVKQIIDFTMKYIMPVVGTAFAFILMIVKTVMPFVVSYIKSTWETVKAIIKNTLNIIENVIELFSNMLQGNWKGVWNNIKEILSSALNLLLNLAMLYFLGRIFGVFRKFVNDAGGKMREIVEKISKPFGEAYERVKGWVEKIKKSVSGMFSGIKVPKFSFSGSMNPVEWAKGNTPKIGVSWNAKGNIFNGASILGGGQGVGEAGAEAVMPIQHKRYMKPYASAVATHLSKMKGESGKEISGNKYEIIFNQPVIIREDADIQRIVEELERRRKITERARGVFSY